MACTLPRAPAGRALCAPRPVTSPPCHCEPAATRRPPPFLISSSAPVGRGLAPAVPHFDLPPHSVPPLSLRTSAHTGAAIRFSLYCPQKTLPAHRMRIATSLPLLAMTMRPVTFLRKSSSAESNRAVPRRSNDLIPGSSRIVRGDSPLSLRTSAHTGVAIRPSFPAHQKRSRHIGCGLPRRFRSSQ